jgi:hypothetical protein
MNPLEEQNIEFQRILCEIRSKNGLSSGIGTGSLNTEGDENSSQFMECRYTNSQDKKSRGKGGRSGR